MIEDFVGIFKTVIAILPSLLLCLLSSKVNLEKQYRYRQFLMPVFALIYVFSIMLILEDINSGLIKFINNIPIWINSLGEVSWMPESIKDILNGFSGWINELINNLNLKYWIFYISNAVIMSGYLIFKKISITIFKKIYAKNRSLVEKIASRFYEYFIEKDTWCLKDKYVDARLFSKVAYFSVVFITSIIMLLSGRMYNNNLLADVFYPVLSVILVGELYFYLDGCSRREYIKDILGEDEDAYKIVNYSLLRKYLRNIFGDKLLSENTNVNIGLSYDVTNEEVLEELLNNEDPKVVSFATYYNALNKTGFMIDHNFMRSSLDLLNGNSILFNDPFYYDLIPYAFYPLNRTLLSHRKVLVVLGRHSIEDEVKKWIEDGIEAVTNIPFLWKTGILESKEKELDIGIVTRSDILNMKVHNANTKFLENVGFVVIIEPSKLITTAQIGLNLLMKKCYKNDEDDIVFCMCDKNCDGLVDAMSHILMTSITEVSATKKHLGTCSYMCWEYDDDYIHHRLTPNISRYLGMGTELSFAALKNQISETMWYGGEAFPVTDMNWIVRQYYYNLMKFASLPTDQDALNNYFHTSPNFYSAEIKKNNYFTVEDESYNMFETLRAFSTRSTEQGFINIISSSYLLKDYMADNDKIFETDAKAIPYIVADYVRSDRNVILRLLLLLCDGGLEEEKIRKEFSLIGLPAIDLKKQIWFEIYRSLSSVADVENISDNYIEMASKVYPLKFTAPGTGDVFDKSIIRREERFNFEQGCMEMVYYINDNRMISNFVSKLKSVAYMSEDEKGDKYYLGSEISDHIYQKLLPGQFFTYNGKYYEMQYVTTDGQVLVRRASDHINGRHSYRQIRNYILNIERTSNKIGSVQNIGGIKIVKAVADFSVETEGYFKMSRYEDFKSAKKVIFEGEKSGIPNRSYFNKSFLKIILPSLDGALTADIRYTITVLINEIFKTLFAENHPYIVAVTNQDHITDSNLVKPLTYNIVNNTDETDENSIYIFEDSNLDMGLLVAVERNLTRIFRIIEDYLSWNKRAIAISLIPPKIQEPVIIPPEKNDFEEGNKKKGNIFSRMGRKIGSFFKKIFNKIFRRKPKPEEEDDIGTNEENPVTEENTPENIDTIQDNTDNESKADDQSSNNNVVDETDEGGETKEINNSNEKLPNMPSQESEQHSVLNESNAKSPFNFTKVEYHKRYYLLFGDNVEPDTIDSKGTLSYLKGIGFGNNPLKEARRGKRIAKYVEDTFQPNKKNARYCDFCGSEIFGVEYETLSDGRDRCISCSRTAIKTEKEFIKVFEDVKRNLESFFGIKINTGIKVEMVNSSKLHKSLGQAFIPTPNNDGRVLGVAIKQRGGGYIIRVENGSPRLMSMMTIAHELTHIWQYLNWDDKDIKKKYGKDLYLQIYEGMAKWVEIQYAYLINEPSVAKRQEIITIFRGDEYGEGFIRYKANYPLSLTTVISRDTPFMNTIYPLDPMYCGSDISVMLPVDNGNNYDDDFDDDDYDDYLGFDDFNEDDNQNVVENKENLIQRNTEFVSKYAYERLIDVQKELYTSLLDVITNCISDYIDLPQGTYEENLDNVVTSILADHPELFYFSGSYNKKINTDSNEVTSVMFKYDFTKENIEKRKIDIDNNIKPFLLGISEDLSDYEAAKTIYKNIIDLCDYDSVTLKKSENMDIENLPPEVLDLRSIYGVIVNRKAVCAGYAKATQYLMNMIGIECMYVVGTVEDEVLHAWNLINLEGDYYFLDTTWDDHSNTSPEKNISSNVTFNYFCITLEELLLDHKPDKYPVLPDCTATKCNYYIRSGHYIENYKFDDIRTLIVKSVFKDDLSISLKCSSKSVFNILKEDLIENGKFHDIIQYINMHHKIRLSSTYRYLEKENKYVLTFILNKI